MTSMASKPQTSPASKSPSSTKFQSSTKNAPQSKTLPVKQTTQFKAKQQTSGASRTVPVMKPGLPSSASSIKNQNLKAKLSQTGVTLSKADKQALGGPRNSPSPVVSGKPSSASSGQPAKAPGKDVSQQISKKFPPYLNISQVPSSSAPTPSGASTSPLVSVKPSSQLLKPGALTNMSKTVASVAVPGAKQAVNTHADAKNKLAMFKAQV